MKTYLILLLLLFSTSLYATVSYDISIDKSGYNLTMDMSFNKGQRLQAIKWALKNGELLSKLSPNIVSVTTMPIDDTNKYHSLMLVKSFGIYSKLLSQCEEKTNETAWSRTCSLQTREQDGGKYMQWKGDEVECSEGALEVDCHFVIRGQAKPVRILGIQIVSAELFSVKAKLQAVANFFKLFVYMNDFNLSPKLTLEKFDHSPLKAELDLFEKEATKAIKSKGQYHHKFSLKDE